MFGFNYSPPVISSIRLENLEVSAQSAASTAIEIKNDVQALHDTVLQYRNESEFYFTQVQQIQEGDYITTQSLSDTLGAFGFDDLANVPAAFVPVAHSHLWADITDKPAEFKPAAHLHKWADITDKPVEFEPAEHIHTWQQIAEKPGTFPPESHFHSWEEIENKPAKFNPVAHQHSWADVTGKPATFAPAAHGHAWSEIAGKPNLVEVGDFGLGANGGVVNDVHTIDKTGFYSVRSDTPNGFGGVGYLLSLSSNPDASTFLASDRTAKEMYFITSSGGVFDSWNKFWHGGNFLYARNVSGANEINNSTISGSNLNPAQAGTWRNVSGQTIENNELGLWQRV